jgi:uncharacterized membrane protein
VDTHSHRRTALIAGVAFIALGALFFLDALGLLVISTAYIWPVVLIGLGIVVMVRGRPRPAPREVTETKVVSKEEEEGAAKPE